MEKSLTECRDDSYTIFVTFYKEPTRKDKIQQIQHRWIDSVIEFVTIYMLSIDIILIYNIVMEDLD